MSSLTHAENSHILVVFWEMFLNYRFCNLTVCKFIKKVSECLLNSSFNSQNPETTLQHTNFTSSVEKGKKSKNCLWMEKNPLHEYRNVSKF